MQSIKACLRALSVLLVFSLLFGSCAPSVSKIPGSCQQPCKFRGKASASVSGTYLLYIPAQYDSHRRWPVIIYLHGASLRGSSIDTIKQYGLPLILDSRCDFPFIVISPQCRTGKTWTDPETLIALLDEVSGRYSVDPDRVYVTGISMGGTGAWLLASRHPERFAAIAPLCAYSDTSWAPTLKDVPAWVFHGLNDTVCPISEAEEMVNAVITHGGEVIFSAYPLDGHNIVRKVYGNERLYEWFLEKRRKGSRR
ncbi:prolyl oligopeptidase family serine peptidase [bacterium]|nr:prolyl oligopeptidase family serine peptidase [bacterium]